MNDIYYHEKDLERMGLDLLVVIDKNKAIVRLEDEETIKFSDKLKNYDEKKFKTYLRKLQNIEPIETQEKIEITLESEMKKPSEDKELFVEIRLFPNLDHNEYKEALKSIKEYIVNKGEEYVSETIKKKRAKTRVKIHLSSIRELTEGVEPISTINTVPRYRIGLSPSRTIDDTLEEFHPQIKEDSPTVCVIDSGVIKDHPLLEGVIDEVADFSKITLDGYDNNGHGTFVTGLISYGDSFHREIIRNPDIKVIATKVMDENNSTVDLEEILPEVVKQFHGKTRVFNMSISTGSRCRILDTELASIIDTLERKYDVIFCIPTGNIDFNDIEKFINNGESYPDYLDRTESLLLQPGEACNCITVGSIARKESLKSLARKNDPSPFTRRGPTPEGRIKPDFVEFDGNLSHIQRSNDVYLYGEEDTASISLNSQFENKYLTSDSGTSFSAPFLSRYAAKIIEKFPSASPNLVKALLMNSVPLSQITNTDKRVLGHGTPSLENALYSTPFSITYYLESSVNMNEEKIIKFRVPEKMSKIHGKKRISIVLVYDPPVDSSKEYYILTGLDFKLHKGGTKGYQNSSHNWHYYNKDNNKWDNAKIGVYEWQRAGWGQDWDIHIIPHHPRALEYEDYDQRFALVVTLEDISKRVDIHTAVMNELGITVRDIERIRIR